MGDTASPTVFEGDIVNTYDEAALVAKARELLGTEEEVLAAGVFSLASVAGADIAGGTAGALLTPGDNPFLSALGAILGRHAAAKAHAESKGATVQLIVAITADTVHVLNADTHGRLDAEFTSFGRATTTTTVRKVGLSRILALADGDHTLELHGTAASFSPLAEGDALVTALLTAPVTA